MCGIWHSAQPDAVPCGLLFPKPCAGKKKGGPATTAQPAFETVGV
jgi:hypothetical protein